MSRNDKSSGMMATFSAIMLSAGALVVLEYSGPVRVGAAINPVSAIAAFVLAICCLSIAANVLRLLGRYLVWRRARTPTGLKGTAGCIKSLAEIRHELARGWGPWWGVFRGEPVIAPFEASAFCCGPSGSGKSTRMVLTNAMALRGVDKCLIDFKSDLTPVLLPPLSKCGDVRILNLGGLFPDIVGEGDDYNPLHVVADDYWRPGGLQDVSDDVHEMSLQLLPEPSGSQGKHQNSYFDYGSRDLIAFAIQMNILIEGYEATLADVALMLNDRESLLRHAQWAAGMLELAEEDA